MKKILIVGPSWLGDMIMAQVLFKILKQQGYELHVLAPKWCFAILACMPNEVNHAIEMPFEHGELKLWARYKLGKELAKYSYQQAIILPNSWKSALVPWFANIPLRTGWLGELRWGLLNDVRKLDKTALPKLIQRYAALAYAKNRVLPNNLPLPALQTSAQLVAATCEQFKVTRSKPILALCPGAAFGAAKRWPEFYYLEVALQQVQAGWQIWLFGAQADREITTYIQHELTAAGYDCNNFAGQLQLPQTVALMSVVDAVITNDSGLMHVAASLAKPLLGIYGPTNQHYTPPLGANSHIISKDLACSPCMQRTCPLQHHNCMRQIAPAEVMQLLGKLCSEQL